VHWRCARHLKISRMQPAIDFRSSACLDIQTDYLGGMNRRRTSWEEHLQRWDQAWSVFSTSGELGIVYRHMDRFEDARRTFDIQYETAKQLKYERAMRRPVGNIGMVNYQHSLLKGHDEALLKLAIAQLIERVQIARRIKELDVTSSCADPSTRAHRCKQVAAWKTIGLARLSLCYTTSGNIREAIATALGGLNLANGHSLEDSTVLALSRFFYGRALMQDAIELCSFYWI
jgi:hypothetical protein